MSDLDRFEIFACVAQSNSLTQAAKRLNLAKASLSKHIKKLEQEFKIDLFTRDSNRLNLTPQGEVLLEQCVRLQKELDETRTICKKFHDEPEGVLHITIFEYFANKILFPEMHNFLKMYPKLEMIIDVNERIPDFHKEKVDIAVGFSLTPENDLQQIIQKSICTTRYVLCGAPKYFESYPKPNILEDLLDHHYIAHASRIAPQNMIRLKPQYKITLKPYMIINHVSAIIESAKAGLGLIQLPLYVVKPLLDDGTLVEVLEEYQATDMGVYYYYPKFRSIQPKVRKFIDYFLPG